MKRTRYEIRDQFNKLIHETDDRKEAMKHSKQMNGYVMEHTTKIIYDHRNPNDQRSQILDLIDQTSDSK